MNVSRSLRRFARVSVWTALASLSLAENTEAAPVSHVVYDNGPLLIAAAAGSDSGGGTSGSPVMIADQFMLGEAITVQGIRFWGTYQDQFGGGFVAAPNGDDFDVAFYANDTATDLPGELVEVQDLDVTRIFTGLTNPQGFDIYEYESRLHPFRLRPAGTYWISIYNNTPEPLLMWLWTYSGPVGRLAFSVGSFNDGAWFAPPTFGNLSFQLLGAPRSVPEPEVLSLLGLASFLTAGRRFLEKRLGPKRPFSCWWDLTLVRRRGHRSA